MYTVKYVDHKGSLDIIAANIHLIWVIEEYAIIFRRDVWFNPPRDPIITDIIVDIVVN